MSIEEHLSNLELTLGELNEVSLKNAYRRLAMKYHPDRTKGDDTWFKRIKASYEWLDANLDSILNEPVVVEPVYRSSFSKAPIQPKTVYNTSKKPYVYPKAPKWQYGSSLSEDPYVKRFESTDPDDRMIGERQKSNTSSKRKEPTDWAKKG
jgi:hypothetical protein